MSISQGSYVGLGTLESDIWRRLQEPQSVQSLCAAIAQDYEADLETIGPAVITLLGTLHEQGMIEVEN